MAFFDDCDLTSYLPELNFEVCAVYDGLIHTLIVTGRNGVEQIADACIGICCGSGSGILFCISTEFIPLERLAAVCGRTVCMAQRLFDECAEYLCSKYPDTIEANM